MGASQFLAKQKYKINGNFGVILFANPHVSNLLSF